jgi:MFS family permease
VRLGAYLVDGRPLAIPAFRRLWIASAVAAVGGSFSLVAVPTQLFTVTGSSAAIGVASAVGLVALVVSALWSGALADATDRRRLLLVADAVLCLGYLGLWLNAVSGLNSVPVLYLLVAVEGFAYGAIQTTTGAAVPRIVPRDLLVAANSLSSLTRYTGAVVGPLLAGALIPVVGLGTLYLLDALALGVVLWAVMRLPAMPPAGPPDGGTPYERSAFVGRPRIHWGGVGILRQVGHGFRYLAGRRVLVGIIAVDLAAMVFALPFALYPELAERAYGGPPGGGRVLGLLFAAYPVGVFLAGLLSGTFSRARRHGALMAGAAIAWGCCVVALGLAARLWLAVAALVVGGAVNFALSTFRNAISQAHTDDALRGRIQGAMTVILVGGPQLANLLHGIGAPALGARWTVAIGGVCCVLAVALILWRVPQLWRYSAS